MSEQVVFPDAVATVRAELAAGGITVPIVSRVPADRPDSFVQIRRTGGVSRDVVIDGAFLTVDAWEVSQPAAMALAQQVRAVMHEMANTSAAGVAVYRVRELAGPSDFPDVETGSPRVRQSFQVGLRGQKVGT